jgi:hypothetical protein
LFSCEQLLVLKFSSLKDPHSAFSMGVDVQLAPVSHAANDIKAIIKEVATPNNVCPQLNVRWQEFGCKYAANRRRVWET